MQGIQQLEAEREKRLKAARRIVVKLGTSTVTGSDGLLCAERVGPLVRSIAALMKSGRQVVVVSSGAVGMGRAWLNLHQSRLRDVVTKQACAAVGQSLLMDDYKRLFGEWNAKVAQILLTEEDFTIFRRYSNLQKTIEKLLQFHVIPIINENDTVSTAELAMLGEGRRAVFSDNDRLAALVMSGLEADALVLLTNVEGFLRKNSTGTNEVIPLVEEVTDDLKALAAGPSGGGRGGMTTKIEAAEIAMQCGGAAIIANGNTPKVLEKIFAGEKVGTTFLPFQRLPGKRRWIAFAADVQGRIVVDAGAERAITQGKASLLASGVLRIDSHFAPKDVVSIVRSDGREIARGIADCASHDAEEARVAGRKAKSSAAVAGKILVRRDNIVLLQKR